jgi:hypothetical protein
MSLNYNFDKSSHNEVLKEQAWNGFIHNYELLNNANFIAKFSDRDFKVQGIPSPRQYITWRKIIKMIGEDNFSRLPLEVVNLSDLEILLVDRFSELFKSTWIELGKNVEVTFSCGFFWRTVTARREKMKKFIRDNILANGWKVKIFTQDKYLKKEFKKHKNLKIKRVRHRIDVHYIIVDNKARLDKSYIFLELPHSESFYFRLDTYFNFEQIKDFSNPSKDIFLGFLKRELSWHPWEKSIPSRLNFAINRK